MRLTRTVLAPLFVGLITLCSCAVNNGVSPEITPSSPKLAKKTKASDESESPAEKAKRLEQLRTGRPEAISCDPSEKSFLAPEIKKSSGPNLSKPIKKKTTTSSMAGCSPKPAHKHKPTHSVITHPPKKKPEVQPAKVTDSAVSKIKQVAPSRSDKSRKNIDSPRSQAPTKSVKPNRVAPKQPATGKKKIKSNLI